MSRSRPPTCASSWTSSLPRAWTPPSCAPSSNGTCPIETIPSATWIWAAWALSKCTQTHTENGPLLWTVINVAAGGIHTPPPALEQYQGPNPWITLYVVLVATNGYQSLVSEAEIDPAYGNQPVVLSLIEDGKPMADAPHSNTNKAPAQLVVPGDYKGGRYANRICRIVVRNGAVGPDLNPPKRVL
jgi:hypothetical protein